MSDQLTVRLPRKLSESLEAAATRLRRKRSEVVRMALEQYLQADVGPKTRPVEHVRDLLGSLESGVADLASGHRQYVLESLKRGR